MTDPATYRDLAERSWAWALTQVRRDDQKDRNAQRDHRLTAIIVGNLPPQLANSLLDLIGGNHLPQTFIGRISPEKGVERAIAIAQRAGIPLKIAAKVDNADREYYNSNIKRLLKAPGIDFIGEIGEAPVFGDFLRIPRRHLQQ